MSAVTLESMDERANKRAWNGPRAQCWLILPGAPGRPSQHPDLSCVCLETVGLMAQSLVLEFLAAWPPGPAIPSCVDETCTLSATVSICGNGATEALSQVSRGAHLWTVGGACLLRL